MSFEILVGHIPFLSELHAGVLMLGENLERSAYAVGPGFLEVSQSGHVEVLVDQAVATGQIDLAAAKADLAKTADELKAWNADPDGEYEALRARHAWARAQLDAHARVA